MEVDFRGLVAVSALFVGSMSRLPLASDVRTSPKSPPSFEMEVQELLELSEILSILDFIRKGTDDVPARKKWPLPTRRGLGSR